MFKVRLLLVKSVAFSDWLLQVRQQDRDLDWSESQDLINVFWHTRELATLHILVVHIQIILLTFGQLPYAISLLITR